MSIEQPPRIPDPVPGAPYTSRMQLIRDAFRGTPADFTCLPVRQAIVLLAVPMVLEMALESVFAVTDIFFVARLGAEAVAAVGLTEAVLTLVYAVAIGLSMATTAMVARRIGEHDPDAAATAAAQSLWAGMATAVLVGGLGVAFADDILRLMGAGESVIRDGATYTAVILGGSVTVLFLFLINAIFRGAGDATVAMRSLWLANGINIVLDPCLIFGLGPFPEMGVAGAAVATTIGRGVGVLYQLYKLFGPGLRIRLGASHLKVVPQVLLRLIRVSGAGIMQFLFATSAWIGLMTIMARFGAEAVAGYTIAIRVIIFTILPAWGLGNAAATLVGQNLGAGQPERASRSVWICAYYNAFFMTGIGVLFIGFAPWIIGLFTAEPAVLESGIACLRVLSLGYPAYAFGMITVQALNGAGDTDTPMYINLVCFWLIQIPLAWVLAFPAGLETFGVFWAIVSAELIMTLLAVWAFTRGRWRTQVI